VCSSPSPRAPRTSGKPFGDPIPAGEYEILAQARRENFYRLDRIDNMLRNDIDDESGRNEFRLHRPGRTIGCIAAKEWEGWNRLKRLIDKTRTDTVLDHAHPWWKFWAKPEPILKYGTLTVK
jgi:hypothetical protein